MITVLSREREKEKEKIKKRVNKNSAPVSAWSSFLSVAFVVATSPRVLWLATNLFILISCFHFIHTFTHTNYECGSRCNLVLWLSFCSHLKHLPSYVRIVIIISTIHFGFLVSSDRSAWNTIFRYCCHVVLHAHQPVLFLVDTRLALVVFRIRDTIYPTNALYYVRGISISNKNENRFRCASHNLHKCSICILCLQCCIAGDALLS